MRKTYLTQEYSRESVSGFMNTFEQRMFNASKVLYTPYTINIDNTDISYSMTDGGVNDSTQNLDIEVSRSFNSENKLINNSIVLKDSSTTFYSYELKINIKNLFNEYLYANIMNKRIFQNIYNTQTISGVKDMIYNYISDNVINRYRFVNINLYIEYYNIGNESEGNTPIYDSNFIKISPNPNESTSDYKERSDNYKKQFLVKNFQITTDQIYDVATILFKKTFNQQYGFKYYFDVIYQQI